MPEIGMGANRFWAQARLMENVMRTVSTVGDLVAAAADEAIRRIVVEGEISGVPSLRLAPGQQLVGGSDGATLVFADGVDGLRLSRDNEVSRLRLRADPSRRAIFNDTAVDDLGTVRLSAVTAWGQVQILADERVRAGHVVVDGLHVVSADLRVRHARPELLGVEVLQGAFTLWNRQPDAGRSEEHTSELQSRPHLVCRLLLEKKKHSASFRDRDLNTHSIILRALIIEYT